VRTALGLCGTSRGGPFGSHAGKIESVAVRYELARRGGLRYGVTTRVGARYAITGRPGPRYEVTDT
jgi:hypothetical protein